MLARIMRGASWVFVGILLGRLLGFVRELLISRSLGAGSEADIAVLVLTVPSLLLDLLIGGALGAALVPAFVQARAEGRETRLYRRVLTVIAVIFVLLAAIFAYVSPIFVQVLAPGMSTETREICSRLVAIGFISLPLTAMSAVGQAFLHARGNFRIASLGTPLYNACLVVPLALLESEAILKCLPILVVSGALLRYVLIAVTVEMASVEAGSIQADISRPLWGRYIQALVSGSVVLLMPVIARGFASLVGDGNIAIINYASKVIELPLGSCLTVLSVVLLPRFSELLARPGGFGEVRALLDVSIGVTLALALPITIGMLLFSESLAMVMFSGGRMRMDETMAIASTIRQLAYGLPALALVALTQAVLHAKGDMMAPLKASAWGLGGLLLGGIAASQMGSLDAVAYGWAGAGWLVLTGQIFALHRHGFPVLRMLARHKNIAVCLTALVIMYAGYCVAGVSEAGRIASLAIMAVAATCSLVISGFLLGASRLSWIKRGV